MSSRITNVTGNEAGIGGGVVSGVNVGMCKPVENYAPTVKAEGMCLLRHDTIMEMNTAGPDGVGNVRGKIVYSANSSAGSSTPESCNEDEAKAKMHIRKALKENDNDIQKAHDSIQNQRRASQAASDDKSLIYAHYWLKGAGMAPLGNFGRGLGAIYLYSKKYNLKFDKLSQINVSKAEPAPYDENTLKWFSAGIDGKLPC